MPTLGNMNGSEGTRSKAAKLDVGVPWPKEGATKRSRSIRCVVYRIRRRLICLGAEMREVRSCFKRPASEYLQQGICSCVKLTKAFATCFVLVKERRRMSLAYLFTWSQSMTYPYSTMAWMGKSLSTQLECEERDNARESRRHHNPPR